MHERLPVNGVDCGLAPDVVRFGAAVAADSAVVDGVVDSADAVA